MFTRISLFALFAVLTLSGCKTRPSANVYQGNGPSIHYHEAESAGGPVRTTHFR
jgi:hypothetical protein